MSLAMVLKIFSDCSLCFGILGLIEADFPVPLLIPALLCAISVGIATFCEEKGWPAWRRLCALLPWGCLLLGENGLQMILLSVPAAYSALVILCNKLELEYYAYRRFFKQSLMLLGGAYLLLGDVKARAADALFFAPLMFAAVFSRMAISAFRSQEWRRESGKSGFNGESR
jgi:hypothetical protein